MGDKDIPYRLLRKVMFTAARAGLQRRLVRGAAEVRAVRAGRMSEAGRVSMQQQHPQRLPARQAQELAHDRQGVVSPARPALGRLGATTTCRFAASPSACSARCAIFFLLMPWLPVRHPDPSLAPVVSAPMAKLLLAQEAPKPSPRRRRSRPRPICRSRRPRRPVALNNNKPDPIRPPAPQPDSRRRPRSRSTRKRRCPRRASRSKASRPARSTPPGARSPASASWR